LIFAKPAELFLILIPKARDLFPEYPKQQRQDDADEDAGGDGEIEAEFFFSNNNIPWKPSDPWNFLSNKQKKANEDDKNTQKNK
jgi:hypothetical protein